MTRPAGQHGAAAPDGLERPTGRPAPLTRQERARLRELVSARRLELTNQADRARWAKGQFAARYRKPL